MHTFHCHRYSHNVTVVFVSIGTSNTVAVLYGTKLPWAACLCVGLKQGLEAALALLLHKKGLLRAPTHAQRAISAAADHKITR